MKTPQLLTLGALAIAAVSCGSLTRLKKPLSSGGFDPLDSPGSSTGSSSAVVAPTTPSYKRGQWVETSMPNATFFKVIPKGSAQADKVLPVATPMKVVSSKGTYVKVELDSGDVGYVPEIMVIGRSAAAQPGLEAPDYGPVPPPVEPGIGTPGIAPPPEVPGTPPPLPTVPPVPPVPPVPDVPAPTDPGSAPTVPDVAPPPEVPGITDPTTVD